MNHKNIMTPMIFFLLAMMAVSPAWAWGYRTQQGITATSLQILERTFPKTFRTDINNYESDLSRGSTTDPATVYGSVPLNEDEAMAIISKEIQLLRGLRASGISSYYAFRMGVLSALVADMFLPCPWEEPALRKQITADIENHYDLFTYEPEQVVQTLIINPNEYFNAQRPFFEDNVRMVMDDYKSGIGYNGFLAKGAESYFGKAIEAVADVWYSILRQEEAENDRMPSPQALTWYYFHEIEYLINVKNSVYQAEKAYKNFVENNPGIMETYEYLGDLYYQVGTQESKARAIEEWQIAYNSPGPQQAQVAQKLAMHYMGIGESFFKKASEPGSKETDLPNARENFTKVLEYDRNNELATQRLNETQQAMVDRQARYDLALSIIAQADTIMKQAEKMTMKSDFGNAIVTYNQAADLFGVITEEFSDLFETAKKQKKEISKQIRDVINKVLTQAREAIDSGDSEVEQNNFEEAIKRYEMVESIVTIIPEEEKSTYSSEKQELLDTVTQKIKEAKTAKMEWEKKQEQQKSQGLQGQAPQEGQAPQGGQAPPQLGQFSFPMGPGPKK